jgi:hypothetical protein
MQLANRSAYHRTSKLLPLVNFVAARMECPDTALIEILDTKSSSSAIGGRAWRHEGTGLDFVTLTVGRSTTYPRITKHVDEVGVIQLADWEENFVLVLAHELAHIRQFRRRTFSCRQRHAAEVDAERRAKQVLQQYRRIHPWRKGTKS